MELNDCLRDTQEGRWVKVEGTDAEIHVMVPTPKRMRRLRHRCMRRARQGRTEVDDDKLHALLLEECVIGWKNINKDGEPLPCTSENKHMLDDSWTAFAVCWQEVVAGLVEELEHKEEEEEKN